MKTNWVSLAMLMVASIVVGQIFSDFNFWLRCIAALTLGLLWPWPIFEKEETK